MNRVFAALIVFLLVGLSNVAGQNYPSSVYYTSTGRERNSSEVEMSKQAYDAERNRKHFEQMRNMGEPEFVPSMPRLKLSKEEKTPDFLFKLIIPPMINAEMKLLRLSSSKLMLIETQFC